MGGELELELELELEEEQAEDHGGFEGYEPEDGGEDEPALRSCEDWWKAGREVRGRRRIRGGYHEGKN